MIFDGHTVYVRDLKGMRYLARLLADPGGGSGRAANVPRSALGDAGEIIDARAKDAYRRRLAEIDDDIEQAHAAGATDRAVQADTERGFRIRELANAFGLSGRADKPHPRPNEPQPV